MAETPREGETTRAPSRAPRSVTRRSMMSRVLNQTRPLVVLAVLALIAAILVGIAPPAGAEDPGPGHPTMAIWPDEDRLGFNNGWTGMITVSVDGVGEVASFPALEGDIHLGDVFDFQRDQTVTATDGITTKVHTITDLFIDDADPVGDTIEGRAAASSWVTVFAWNGDPTSVVSLDVQAGGDGVWTAVFAGSFDVMPGTQYGAAQGDGDDDWTNVEGRVLSPTISVNPETDRVWGQEWTEGEMVAVSVSGRPECDAQAPVAAWGPNPWEVGFLAEMPCDLGSGDEVTVTGTSTKSHVITALQITSFDYEQRTISGTAAAETVVTLALWGTDTEDHEEHTVIASGGSWTATFTRSFDESTAGGAWQSDLEGDQTQIVFGDQGGGGEDPGGPGEPQIFADLSFGGLQLWGFEGGAGVAVFEDEAAQDPLWTGWVDGEVQPEELGFPLLPGMVITVGDKELEIPDGLAIDTFDTENNLFGGTAPDGFDTIQIVLGGNECDAAVDVINGRWEFDVSTCPEGFVFDEDTWADARLRDDDGDIALVWWMQPRFTVNLDGPVQADDNISANGWPYGTEIRILVEDPLTGATILEAFTEVDGFDHYNGWDPENPVRDEFRDQSAFSFYEFDKAFGGPFRFQTGWKVTVGPADPDSPYPTKTHFVTDVVPTGVDFDTDTVFGTATPGTKVLVWGCGVDWESFDPGPYGGMWPWGGAWSRLVTADANGDWAAGFNEPGVARFGFETYLPVDPSDFCDLSGNEFGAGVVDDDLDESQRGYLIPGITASLNAGDWINIGDVNTDPKLIEILSEPGGDVLWSDTVEPALPEEDLSGGYMLGVGYDTHGIDLLPGMVVQVGAYGVLMGELILAELTMEMDIVGDVVFGTAPGSEAVFIDVQHANGYCWGEVPVLADGSWATDGGDLNGDGEWVEVDGEWFPPPCQDFGLTRDAYASISVADPTDISYGDDFPVDRTSLQWETPPRWIKESVLEFMEGTLAPELTGRDARLMGLATFFVNQSLADWLWDDYRTLDSRWGSLVFAFELKAVKLLERIQGTVTLCEDESNPDTCEETGGRQIAGGYAWADRGIAVHAVSTAAAAGGSDQWLDKARSKIAKGEQAAGNGNFVAAIQHYATAWSFANRSLWNPPRSRCGGWLRFD